jgi:hypothetical protein
VVAHFSLRLQSDGIPVVGEIIRGVPVGNHRFRGPHKCGLLQVAINGRSLSRLTIVTVRNEPSVPAIALLLIISMPPAVDVTLVNVGDANCTAIDGDRFFVLLPTFFQVVKCSIR